MQFNSTRTVTARYIESSLMQGRADRTLGGSVHSVFPNSINIKNHHGELYTLLNHTGDYGPRSVILDRYSSALGDWGLKAGHAVSCQNGLILIGEMVVDIVEAQDVSCALPELSYSKFSKRQLQKAVASVQTSITCFLIEMQKKYSLKGKTFTILAKELILKQEKLIEAVKASDFKAIEDAVKGLVGFGLGLTPSGDDFLAGFILTHLFLNTLPGSIVSHLKHTVLSYVNQTTEISRMMLMAAVEGKCRFSLSELLKAVAYSHPADIASHAKSVLSIGSTSGMDMCTGVLQALELVWQYRVQARDFPTLLEEVMLHV